MGSVGAKCFASMLRAGNREVVYPGCAVGDGKTSGSSRMVQQMCAHGSHWPRNRRDMSSGTYAQPSEHAILRAPGELETSQCGVSNCGQSSPLPTLVISRTLRRSYMDCRHIKQRDQVNSYIHTASKEKTILRCARPPAKPGKVSSPSKPGKEE